MELHELRRARKRVAIPIPGDACEILSTLGFGRIHTLGQVKFKLNHVKAGVEIKFIVTAGAQRKFTWSISHMLGVWPKDFKAARAWVAAYAARHGQVVEEIVAARMRRPTGDDRKLLRAGGCKEAWLRSDIPTLAAEAAVRCQHPALYCWTDGYCHYGNCEMQMDPSPSPKD